MNAIEQAFPDLAGNNYQITSSKDRNYNCIAWAAGDRQRWWWPGSDEVLEYWPSGVPRIRSRDAFVAAFATLGYQVCDGESQEEGYEKVALFADSRGPTHAARQLPNGRWSSKLGKWEDIEHGLHDLAGTIYGLVILVMKRKA